MSSSDNNDTVQDTPVTDTTETTTTDATESDSERHLGLVKWFTGGHGFITNFDTKDDVFVHHSKLTASVECWKKLHPGDYVEYSVGPADDGKTQAVDVTGVRRGPLRCETHALLRREREEYNTDTRGEHESDDSDSADFNDSRRGGRDSRRGGRDSRRGGDGRDSRRGGDGRDSRRGGDGRDSRRGDNRHPRSRN
jgi:cold shock CspA family protein